MENKIRIMANPIILGDKNFKKSQTRYMGISRNNNAKMCVTIETKGRVTTLSDITTGKSKKVGNIMRIIPQNRREKVNYGLNVVMEAMPTVINSKAICITLIIEGSKIILNKRKIKLKKKELWILYSIWKRTDGVIDKFVSRIHIKEEALKEMNELEFINAIKILEKYKIIEIIKGGYILKEKIKVSESIN